MSYSIQKTAQAGTLESGDIMIIVAPADGEGIVIELESLVLAQYGRAIKETMLAVLAAKNVINIRIKAIDRGALDCTIRARVLAALARAGAPVEGGCSHEA